MNLEDLLVKSARKESYGEELNYVKFLRIISLKIHHSFKLCQYVLKHALRYLLILDIVNYMKTLLANAFAVVCLT